MKFHMQRSAFPIGTRNVAQITFFDVEKLNRIDFISLSLIALDLKSWQNWE